MATCGQINPQWRVRLQSRQLSACLQNQEQQAEQTAWAQLDNTAWKGLTAQVAARKGAQAAFLQAQWNAQLTYTSAMNPLVKGDFAQQEQIRFQFGEDQYAANFLLLEALQAYQRQSILAQTPADQAAADTPYQKAQQQYQLSLDQAQIDKAKAYTALVTQFVQPEQDLAVTLVRQQTQAQAQLATALAQADATFIATQAPAVAVYNMAVAQAQALQAEVLAQATAAENETVA